MQEHSAEKVLYILCVTVSIFSLVKGLAIAPHPYALSQHLYSYENGFLIRGLLGQIYSFFFDNNWYLIKQAVNISSLVTCFTVTGYVIYLVHYRFYSQCTPYFFLLVASGPLFVTIGATRGYFDSYILLLGLLSYFSYKDQRMVQSIALFSVALLIHEMVAIFILPLFVLDLMGKQKKEVLIRGGVILVLVFGTIMVTTFGIATEKQADAIQQKAVDAAESLSEGWRPFEELTCYAVRNNPARAREIPMIDKIINRVWKWKAYIFANVAIIFLVVLPFLGSEYGKALVIAGVSFSPHVINFIAFDHNRFMGLATLTSLVAGLTVFSTHQQFKLRNGLKGAIVIISLVQLCIVYDVVPQYARGNTLLGLLLKGFNL